MANIGYIQITRLCNQECRFCSNPTNDSGLSLGEGKKAIDRYIKEGYNGIILTGGEPTLSPCLNDLISYCVKKNVDCRIITNGQKLADYDFLKSLYHSGLRHLNLSMYSCRPSIQAMLTNNPAASRNILRALDNVARLGKVRVDINTVINHYNADHLSKTVKFIIRRYPFVRHFVFNNLDPTMNRASENPDTIPRLIEFELELSLAMQYLKKAGKTFRVERVPLCYMGDFQHLSTETRKIVKGEERTVFFLDKRGTYRQTKWGYDKAECCNVCFLNEICAGLYEMDKYYSSDELYPVFISPDTVKAGILKSDLNSSVE